MVYSSKWSFRRLLAMLFTVFGLTVDVLVSIVQVFLRSVSVILGVCSFVSFDCDEIEVAISFVVLINCDIVLSNHIEIGGVTTGLW